MHKYLHVTYGCPDNPRDSIVLNYRLEETDLVERWIAKVKEAQRNYTIDDPKRFYGFGSVQEETDKALTLINSTIDTINSHRVIVNKKLTDVNDQDTLNYLHNIFEIYHGLLDQQTHEFYQSAPTLVKQALANLNLEVHRCETVSRANKPRHVVTWFGLPKTHKLNRNDYNSFKPYCEFGGLYLNYVEIGKTLEDLVSDQDSYISDNAFKPFVHYSADFNVKFYDKTVDLLRVRNYYEEHQLFFDRRGYTWEQLVSSIGHCKLGKLTNTDNDTVLAQLKTRQLVTNIDFS